jgi:hypothetical protein
VEDGQATLAVINAMISDLGSWNLGLPLEEELRRTWPRTCSGGGPKGSAPPTQSRAMPPSTRAPSARPSPTAPAPGHLARLAEGHYGGFFGWPNFTARHTGGFMGLPGSDKPAEFRVVDIYRREGDKLAENWIFIDMLHFFRSQGVDLLARMSQINDS